MSRSHLIRGYPSGTGRVRFVLAAACLGVWTGSAVVGAPASTGPAVDLLRDALEGFDAAQPDAAVAALDRAVAQDASAAPAAAVIASLHGRPAAAVRYLQNSADPTLRLLAGEAALRAGDPALAATHFDAALAGLTRPADRRYAIERRVAAARAAGTLGALFDRWLAEADAEAERALPLVALGRELGRVPEVIAWWSRRPGTTGDAAVTRAVLAAARADGRTDDALRVCRRALAERPDDIDWLGATLGVLIDAGRPDEADSLITDRAAGADPAALVQLGGAAESLGRDAAALRVADALDASPAGAIDGCLLAARVVLRRGDTAAGAAALRRAAGLAAATPARVAKVATALEAADLSQDSVTLLTGALRAGGGDELAMRLANLLAQQKRPGEAIALLDELRRHAATPAARAQASRQLLDAAAASGKLAGVVASFEAAPPANLADLDLLVDAYARLKRPDAAGALLRGTPLLDRLERLRRLAVFEQRQKAFDKADAALRDLLAADSADAADTWRQIAAVAAARHRPGDIEEAVRELRRLLAPGPESDEMLAGLLSQLDRPADAAAAYAAALAARPENTDDWLLWASAMGKSGQQPQAVERLTRLARTAATPALFAAAADALLNLDAPPDVLRAVRREAALRVARTPGNALGYSVVADLCDELKDVDGGTRVGELSIVFGSETRPQALREQMEAAIARYQTDVAVSAGRTLLALGDDFPPALFLDLGEQLLLVGRDGEAGNAFARAVDAADEADLVPKVAGLLAEYGHADQARRQLASLARRRPFDSGVLNLLAVQDQVCGDPASAFEHALAALDGTLQDLPATQATSDNPIEAGLVSDALPYVTPLNTALQNAATPQQQARLLEMLGGRFAAALTRPERAKEALSLSHAIRRAALVLGRFDLADATDDTLLQARPQFGLADTLLDQRWQYGVYANARAFALRHNMADRLPPMLAMPFPDAAVATTTSAPATRPALLPDAALAWLPRLAWQGDADAVRSALASTGATVSNDPSRQMPVRVAAAAAINDPALTRDLVLAWLEQAARPGRAALPARRAVPVLGESDLRFYRPPEPADQWILALTAGWAVLDDTGRVVMARRAVELARDADAGLSTPALRIAAAARVLPDDAPALARRAADRPEGSRDLPALLAVLGPTPSTELLRHVLAGVAPAGRLAVLRDCAATVTDPCTAAAVVASLDAVNGPQQGLDEPDAPAARDDVRRALGRALVRVGGDDPALLVAAARDLWIAGDADGADAAARHALDALSIEDMPAARPDGDDPSDPAEQAAVRRHALAATAARLLSDPARKATLADVATDADWPCVRRALLLDAGGERDAALTQLRDAAARFGDRPLVRVALLARLRADGRSDEVVRRFLPLLASSGTATRAAVIEALADTGRLTEAWHVQSDGHDSRPVPNLIAAAAQSPGRAAEGLRGLLVRLRDNDLPSTLWPPAPPARGLSRRTGRTDMTDVAAGVSGWPGATDDLAQAIPLMPAGGSRSDAGLYWATRCLAGALDPQRRGVVLATLSRKAAAGTLLSTDRVLLQSLAAAGGAGWTPPMIDALRDATIADPSTDRVRALANVLGDSSVAAAATRWADAYDRVGGPQSRDYGLAPTPTPPTPLSDTLGLGTGKWVLARLARDPSAAPALEADLAGLPPAVADPLWARLAAERGDADAFARRLSEWIGQRLPDDDFAPDIRDALPDRSLASDARDRLLDAARRTVEQWHDRSPHRTGWLRVAATLGAWAHTAGAESAATQWRQTAERWSAAVGPCRFTADVQDLGRLLDGVKPGL